MNTNKTNLVKLIGLAIMFCSWTIANAQDQKFAIAAKQNASLRQASGPGQLNAFQ